MPRIVPYAGYMKEMVANVIRNTCDHDTIIRTIGDIGGIYELSITVPAGQTGIFKVPGGKKYRRHDGLQIWVVVDTRASTPAADAFIAQVSIDYQKIEKKRPRRLP